MANNAYYFSHDSNAKDDPKCMLLIDQLGLEGYGIYWVLIEVLRDQPEYKYPLNLIPILARRYNTTAEKMSTVVKNYGLFNFDEENNFFSLSLNKRMDKVNISIEQRRNAGLMSAEKRRSQLLSTTVERPLNDCSTMKRKEKKGNEIKRKENISWRDDFKIYLDELKKNVEEIEKDAVWIAEQEQLNPNVDIIATIKRGVAVFWGVETEGYLNKKKQKTNTINWKSTFAKNMDKNIVWKRKKPIDDLPLEQNSFAIANGLVSKQTFQEI